MIERLRHAVRLEDVLLAGWLILVDPLLAAASSRSATEPGPLDGVLRLIGLAGLAICIGSRSVAGVASGLTSGREISWTVGPLFGAFALVLDQTTTNLGLGDAGPLLILILIVLAVAARFRMPALDWPTRRALVTPFILVSSGSFGAFLSGLRDAFDLRSLLGGLAGSNQGIEFGLFVVGILLLGVVIFYVMLIYAPRQVAEKEGSGRTWAIRYLLFVARLTVGTTLAALLHP